MKKYKITKFGRCDLADTPNAYRLFYNTVNVLLGASMAMRTSSTYRLTTTHCHPNKGEIYFETNNSVFISSLKLELSNYGLNLFELDSDGNEIK